MKSVTSAKILVFYQKDNLDSFLAAHATMSLFPPEKNPPIAYVALGDNDELPELTGRYLFFMHVAFDKLSKPFDMSMAVNAVIVSRSDQVEHFMQGDDWMRRWPKKLTLKGKVTVRCIVNDVKSMTQLAWNVLQSNESRRQEIMPAFIKYMIEILEAEESPEKACLLAGVSRDESIVNEDMLNFEKRVVRQFRTRHEDMKKVFMEEGKKVQAVDAEVVKKLIERHSMLTDFAGQQVPIAPIPEEYAYQVGSQMAIGHPFSVVYEDLLSENKRIYHLYSDKNGLDVGEVAKPYTPVKATKRYASFSVKMNFSGSRWV